MSSQRIETVRVVDAGSEGGYRVINRSDMQKDDIEYKEPAKKSKTAGAARSGSGTDEEVDLESMTKAQLMEQLDKQGVEYASSANKDELLKLAQDSKK